MEFKDIKELLETYTALATFTKSLEALPSLNWSGLPADKACAPNTVWAEHFCIQTFNRIAFQKTFLTPNEPRLILATAVPARISFDKKVKVLSESNLSMLPRVLCIEGSLGMGKSTALKYLATQLLTEGKTLPIFVELRELNNSDASLIDLIAEKLFLDSTKDPKSDTATVFDHYPIILLLDGFDEVAETRRPKLIMEISDIVTKYSDTRILLTTRPEDAVRAISWLPVATIEQLTHEDARSLVTRCPSNEIAVMGILANFEKLASTYEDFFAVPLFLTIFILAYGANPDVPSTPHDFYRTAFSAMFSVHDAQKSIFQRERFSKLALTDYEFVCGAFCAISLMSENYSFSPQELSDLIKKACRISGIEEDEHNLCLDIEKCTCLIQKDGLKFRFTHRSFQDFLAALYISKIADEKKEKFFNAYPINPKWENFYLHFAGIDSDAATNYIIKPIIRHFDLDIKNPSYNQFERIVTQVLGGIRSYRSKSGGRTSIYFIDTKGSDMLSVAKSLYTGYDDTHNKELSTWYDSFEMNRYKWPTNWPEGESEVKLADLEPANRKTAIDLFPSMPWNAFPEMCSRFKDALKCQELASKSFDDLFSV